MRNELETRDLRIPAAASELRLVLVGFRRVIQAEQTVGLPPARQKGPMRGGVESPVRGFSGKENLQRLQWEGQKQA